MGSCQHPPLDATDYHYWEGRACECWRDNQPAASGSIVKLNMDDKRIISGFNHSESIEEMNRRHLRAALAMQAVAMQGLLELRERSELTAAECSELLDAGLKLEHAASPHGSRKRH